MNPRASLTSKIIEQAITALRRQLSKTMTMDEVHRVMGPSLILHGIDFAKRAGVPEADVRKWIEECVHNLYVRGVDIEGRREPS